MSYLFSRFEHLKASGVLPSPTGVALEILRLTQRDDTTVAQLAHVLQADPALAGRLVRFANSSQVGAARPMLAIGDAVKLLGFAVVRQLCLGFSVLDGQREGRCLGFDYPRFWSRSLASALAAQTLCGRVRVLAPEEAFTCGLLAEIGSLALASLHPEKFAKILDTDAAPADRSALERETFGADHREFGAALLEDWRLPRICIDAVFHSEQPEQSGFDQGSRVQTLCEVMSLARLVGEYFVAGIDARMRITPSLLQRAAKLGIEAVVLAPICDAVGEGWQRWASLLGMHVDAQPASNFASEASSEAAADVESALSTPARPETDAVSSPRAAPAALPGLSIDVVCADETTRAHVCELLARQGHRVRSFADANIALATVLTDLPDLVVIDLTACAPAARRLCTTLRATVIGKDLYLIGMIAPNDSADALDQLRAATAVASAQGSSAGPDTGLDDYLCLPIDPASLLLRLRCARRMIGLRAVSSRARDDLGKLAAELAVAKRRLQRALLIDGQTGLPNRRHAFERLEHEWAVSTRHRRPLSCMGLDIDQFRQINAAHGHAAGDKALGRLAAVLRESARTDDVICRMGGEEFMVISPDTDSIGAATGARKLHAAVGEAFRSGLGGAPGQRTLTLSIGVATRDASVRDVESLVRLSDEALQTAKREGSDRVCVAMTPAAARAVALTPPRTADSGVT